MQSIKSLIWLLKMWQGVHLYTMNNEDVAYHVYQATKALFAHPTEFWSELIQHFLVGSVEIEKE